MTDKFYKIISVLAVIALFGIGIGLFVGKIEIKDVQKNFLTIDDANIKDREKGICADMYKEGFDWGVGQWKIDWVTENMSYSARGLTEEQRMKEWWNVWKESYNNQ